MGIARPQVGVCLVPGGHRRPKTPDSHGASWGQVRPQPQVWLPHVALQCPGAHKTTGFPHNMWCCIRRHDLGRHDLWASWAMQGHMRHNVFVVYLGLGTGKCKTQNNAWHASCGLTRPQEAPKHAVGPPGSMLWVFGAFPCHTKKRHSIKYNSQSLSLG